MATITDISNVRTTGTEIGIEDVLAVVREFGEASLEFAAWELMSTEPALFAPWLQAVRTGLIRRVGVCPETGEDQFVAVAS